METQSLLSGFDVDQWHGSARPAEEYVTSVIMGQQGGLMSSGTLTGNEHAVPAGKCLSLMSYGLELLAGASEYKTVEYPRQISWQSKMSQK